MGAQDSLLWLNATEMWRMRLGASLCRWRMRFIIRLGDEVSAKIMVEVLAVELDNEYELDR